MQQQLVSGDGHTGDHYELVIDNVKDLVQEWYMAKSPEVLKDMYLKKNLRSL